MVVSVKEAAGSAGVHPETLARWCRAGLVRARRLARGRGPWRVQLGADGQPLDSDGKPKARAKR